MVRVAAIALVSGSVAACSSDSGRFSESPFSNPFSTASAEKPTRAERSDTYSTASIQAAPTTRVQRAPLGAPSDVQQRPMYGYGGGDQSSNASSGGSYRSSRLAPVSPRSDPASTASISPRGSSNWSSANGTTVTLGRGESITTLATRYGVPASAILQANGLQNANGVGEGSQIVIPTYSGASSRTASAAPVAPSATLRPAAPVASLVGTRPVIARAQPVAAPAAPLGTPAKPRMQLVQGPQSKVGESKAVETKVAEAKPVAPAPAKPAKEQAFAAQPAKPTAAPQPDDKADNVKTAALKVDPTPAPSTADAGPSFRWPARGRVISGYGSKTSGASNDGVNIALPEGTEVKASDDGVVAYSGSELKGFGNLVLIRHSNGWVTAYAHNSALNVKRGDTVRRGQIIAKSGSTGSVSSPQLHFEVRKGAQTVDPMKHLPDV